MAGKPGQMYSRPLRGTVRAKAWQSMQIFRHFSVADLLRTTPGAKADNLYKWLQKLLRHGYIRGDGTAGVGCYNAPVYRLVRDTGGAHPLVCNRCGQPISARECRRQEPGKESPTGDEKGE